MSANADLEYVAIKLRGFKHYIWFKQTKTKVESGTFVGVDGWGNGGALTNVETKENEIESRIYSNTPQYN